MQIIKRDRSSDAFDLIKAGKVVVMPSESCYGLSCLADNQSAVNKIFEIKGRRAKKSLLMVVSEVDMAKKYLHWNDELEKLIDKYWPGALTIVGEYNGEGKLANGVVSKDNTLAVRLTDNSTLLAAMIYLDKPLVSTSANVSGQENVYNSKLLKKVFSDQPKKPDAILDFGLLPCNKPTTVVSVVGGVVEVLRQGEVVLN